MSNSPPSAGDLHDEQVLALLRSGAHPVLLSAHFGETEYLELCQLARTAVQRDNSRAPLVFILPGIMGSRLGSIHRNSPALLWLHPAAIAEGELRQLAMPGSRRLRALGVMLPGYLKLRLQLQVAGFRAVFHPFDWRCDLDLLAREFARTIERSAAQEVLVVAHSMGGLVARMALAHDSGRRIRRLIQLGAPNEGSFAPVQALRAVYPTVRKLAALDHKHTAEELARTVFGTFPGLYQMLPSACDSAEPDFFDATHWPEDGPGPDVKMLARARRIRARMPEADERCTVIAGANQETIVAASITANGFEYAIARDGDGTVPASRARWDGARTWCVEEKHGALTTSNVVLAAVIDLLKEGDTNRLNDLSAPAGARIVRHVTDRELRREVTHDIQWERLSLDSRRRLLEPVISPEFQAPSGQHLIT